MFRPVSYLSFIMLVTLAACGIRFLPDGEALPANTVTELPPVVEETTLPATAVPAETAEANLQPSATQSLLLEVSQPTIDAAAVEPAPFVSDRKPYRLQPGSPTWLPNFIHPEAGCNWLGVAGQVFNLEGNPVTALVVEVGGSLGGAQVQSLSLTGVAPAYGPGGYEVNLGDRVIDSSAALFLQLKDLSGKDLSDRISFDTFADCSRNLVLINFIESSFEIEVIEYFFPLFYNGFSGSLRGLSADRGAGEETEQNTYYFPLFFNDYMPELIATPAP